MLNETARTEKRTSAIHNSTRNAVKRVARTINSLAIETKTHHQSTPPPFPLRGGIANITRLQHNTTQKDMANGVYTMWCWPPKNCVPYSMWAIPIIEQRIGCVAQCVRWPATHYTQTFRGARARDKRQQSATRRTTTTTTSTTTAAVHFLPPLCCRMER